MDRATGEPFERELLDHVAGLLATLPAYAGATGRSSTRTCTPDNVLRAERQPWLVVDPKPLVGEIEFMVGGILRSFDVAAAPGAPMRAFDGLHDRASLLHRFDELTSRLDVDRERRVTGHVAHFIAGASTAVGAMSTCSRLGGCSRRADPAGVAAQERILVGRAGEVRSLLPPHRLLHRCTRRGRGARHPHA